MKRVSPNWSLILTLYAIAAIVLVLVRDEIGTGNDPYLKIVGWVSLTYAVYWSVRGTFAWVGKPSVPQRGSAGALWASRTGRHGTPRSVRTRQAEHDMHQPCRKGQPDDPDSAKAVHAAQPVLLEETRKPCRCRGDLRGVLQLLLAACHAEGPDAGNGRESHGASVADGRVV